MRSILITPPTVEPVVPADVRQYGHMSADVSDAMLTPLITAARMNAEKYQSRAYITQTWDLVCDNYPPLPIKLPTPPLLALLSVTITALDGVITTMDITKFRTDKSGGVGCISLLYGEAWPITLPEWAGVVFRYTCGYGATAVTVPLLTRQAIIFGALWMFDHADESLPPAFFQLLSPDRIELV